MPGSSGELGVWQTLNNGTTTLVLERTEGGMNHILERLMAFTTDQLNKIYDRTSGYCHICHKKLAFKNYGKFEARAAWEVEHSNPQAKGGTDRMNNLYPACISCNRAKSDSSSASARVKNGKVRAPLSKEMRRKTKAQNSLAGGAVGALIGTMAGPVGAFVCALVGAHIGHKMNPDQ